MIGKTPNYGGYAIAAVLGNLKLQKYHLAFNESNNEWGLWLAVSANTIKCALKNT